MNTDDLFERVLPWRLYQRWRDASARWRMLPSYIIIGAQKGGTDSLASWLESHPEVVAPTHKEIFYFGGHFDKGLNWYRRHFPLKWDTRRSFVTGEATPDYLYHPFAAERMAKTLPRVRLIVLLRDPVKRAWSQYHHSVRWNVEKRSFAEAIAAEEETVAAELEKIRSTPRYLAWNLRHHSYVSRGLYSEQLRHYYEHFDASQILVLKSEDLFADPQVAFDRVTRFLGLGQFTLTDITPRNTGRYRAGIKEREPELARELYDYYAPYNRELQRMIGARFSWSPAAGSRSADARHS
jgi:hypothetical protein